jgi:hypothetical protein
LNFLRQASGLVQLSDQLRLPAHVGRDLRRRIGRAQGA